ncbi:hypothetical protein GCM10011391_33030 [Pullulanibacillus camelliae]|uniref:DUF4362 domain-containing protein n=1 Tax=Pullulanibacillus camelliae TaxID=1707096 RepID=A0A8J3DZF2_9BACL|nr:DUF4362 domain-containing protein [Pullulanibacillus camelliae]GGE51629.1 hypothetical protein GCM10011391_33030 [Pullulanibacillus camelliae]
MGHSGRTIKIMRSMLLSFAIVFLIDTVPGVMGLGQANESFEEQIEHFGKKYTDQVPEHYPMEKAIKNGDITPVNITGSQRQKIDQFVDHVKNKQADFIRFVRYSPTNDPVITEFQFNGELIYYRFDSTRDKSGLLDKGAKVGKHIKMQTDYCKKLVSNKEKLYLTECYKNGKITF